MVDGGGIVMLFDSDDNFVNAIEADASGNYAFKGLAVGDYTVKVRPDKPQVYTESDQIVQSSALVECINSIIRPVRFMSEKHRMTKGYGSC